MTGKTTKIAMKISPGANHGSACARGLRYAQFSSKPAPMNIVRSR